MIWITRKVWVNYVHIQFEVKIKIQIGVSSLFALFLWVKYTNSVLLEIKEGKGSFTMVVSR